MSLDAWDYPWRVLEGTPGCPWMLGTIHGGCLKGPQDVPGCLGLSMEGA